MKWLRHSLIVLLGIGTLAVATAMVTLWFLGSERGTAWLAARLLARTGPALTVGRVRGSLARGVVIEELRLRLSRDELDIEALALEWNPAAAFLGTLAFDRAVASRVAYRRLPTTDSGGAPLALPFPIRVDEASVVALTLTVAGETLAFADTQAAAAAFGRRLTLERVVSASGDVELAGNATVTWEDGVALTVAADWAVPLAGVPAAGGLRLNGTWPELTVHHELAAPFAAVADGAISFAAAPRVDLAIEWQDLAWPNVAGLASPSGRLTLAGDLGAYRYEGSGALDIAGRAGTFAVRGTGAALELALERLEVEARMGDGSSGTLVGEGRVSLAARDTELAVTATEFDPGWIHSAWSGRLRGSATLRAGLAPAAAAALEAAELTGQLRGYPVTLRGGAAFTAPNRWRLEALSLTSADNLVVLAGTLDSTRLDLAVDADVNALDLLWPGVRGALNGTVAVDGTWQEPHARGRLAARGLAFEGVRVARLEVSGEVGLAPATPLDLTIDAAGIERGPIVVARAGAALRGTTAAHTATFGVEAEDWQAAAAASGGLEAHTWRGMLDRFEFDEAELGRWRLDRPAASVLGVGGVVLATSCLRHDSGAMWCAELDVQGRVEDRVVVSAQSFELRTLRPLLPPELTVDGVYQLSAALFDPTGEPRGALALTGGVTRVAVAFGDAPAFTAELDEIRAGVTLEDRRLEAQASVRSTTAGRADLRASIDDVRQPASPIGGSLRVEWPDLGFLALLSPSLEQVTGSLAVDLAVAGTVAEPAVDGQATVMDGRITVPAWGLVVDEIEATATSGDGRALVFDAAGRAGEGLLTLTGRTELDPGAGWPTRLQLHGDTVRAVQLPEAEIFATPDLRIDVALPDVQVTGSVHVPQATLRLSALPAQAVPPSPDAVLHGAEARSRSRPLRVRTEVALTLGEDVSYEALNLETTVSGQLRLQSEPNASASATGTLSLDGTYDAYGQTLELERGQLLFSGPLDDPGLDVRAVRNVETIRVGVELTGTVKAPRTRVFSTPAMSEADALSYLLLSRPVSGDGAAGGRADTSTLEVAALSMGLQQALPVVQRIGTTLGLDDLALQSTATDAGAIMAGKYLAPKLYVRYSYGLFNRIGDLMLRFEVNDRLSIETRSGDQESMDLLYTVEKD